MVNYDKTKALFSKGAKEEVRQAVIEVLGVKEVSVHNKYLGLPTFVGRSKVKPFLSIKERIIKQLRSWGNNLLSWSGKEVLIKAVAQAIPTYAMSVFKFPQSLCDQIQSAIRKFWWGCKQKRKIYWNRWSLLCGKKKDGGLGFRDLESFNDAMIAKQIWRLMEKEDSLVARLLKAKYYPGCGLFDAELGSKPSFTWRSLHGARWVVDKGTRWLVGNGESINVWTSPWIPRPRGFRVVTTSGSDNASLKVSHVINNLSREWNKELLYETFLPIDVELILSIPLSEEPHNDRRIWHYTTSGEFTVKSAYHLIRDICKDEGGGGMSDSGDKLWGKLWSLQVPPRIKMFGWKMCANGLATGANLSTRLRGFDARCCRCGALCEDDVHALLECPASNEIWDRSGILKPETEVRVCNLKEWLGWCFDTCSEEYIHGIITVLWAIWNVRNKAIFDVRGEAWREVGSKALAWLY